MLALAVAALVWWRVRAGVAAREARVGFEPAERGSDPDREWALALAAAARADHREAIRRAFRSALLETSARGRLHVDSAWTTRELLASAAHDADLVAQLVPAATTFDRAWYSGRSVSAADWETMRRRCDAIRRLARRRAERPA
jgi:hypothetical protein